MTTFAPTTSSGAVQTEYTSTWEVTNTDGSVSTKSGIIDQSGTYFTTLSTFAPTTISGAIETEFTSTWVATDTDGLVSTKSGIVSQSGTSIATLTTFPEPAGTVYPVTTLFTTGMSLLVLMENCLLLRVWLWLVRILRY